IINISDLMAYTLYESNTEKVLVQKELDFIQNYFYLERMRYTLDKDITLDISVEDTIDHIQIAPLLCFTFIENAFKYGLKSTGNNFLKISIN
ncbi:histidine kinase, partial [Bacillus sp. SIMBA_033]